MRHLFTLAMLITSVASALFAQQSAAQQTTTPMPSQTPDIIVQGLSQERRNIGESLVPVPAIAGYRAIASNSATFARCVKHPDIEELRSIIDGMPNSSKTKHALDRLIRSNPGCYPNYPSTSNTPPFFGECNPQQIEERIDLRTPGLTTCAAIYDRGALLGIAIDRYAPDFSLTRDDVNNGGVQKRLSIREEARNRYRFSEDQFYFQAAICMVRQQPELATRLVRAYGDAGLQQRIGQLILVRAKICVGNPKRIKVEFGQFAIYIVDAAYRWEVAARNVDSLLPSAG